VPRGEATERSDARLAARRQIGLAVALLALGALTLVAPRRSAAQGSSDLDRLNGFESGGAGDYESHGSPSGSTFHRLDAAGSFGLETAAASGSDEYVETALSAPATTVTDGIWACVKTTPTGGARRIRSWLSGSDVVVEMRLNQNRLLQVLVNGDAVILSGTPIALCPNFSNILLQYIAGAEGGTVMLSIDGIQTPAAPHASSAAIDATRIGPDDGVARSVAMVWDDHAIVRDVTFPGALRIAGLLPRTPPNTNDPNFRSEWPPAPSCSSAVTCTDEQPPDDDTTFVSTSTIGAMQSFCLQSAEGAAVYGNILAVKHLLESRTTAPPASLSLQLRANAQACGGVGGAATSDAQSAAIGGTYGAATRVDTALVGSPWSTTSLNRAALLVSLESGGNARVSQVVREVAFDTFGFPSPTPTNTRTPTFTLTFTATESFTPTASFTPSTTTTPTPSSTPTPSVTPTPSATATITPTRTATRTPTVTATATDTSAASPTGTATSTRSLTSTPSPSSTPTLTSSATPTGSATTPAPLRGLVRANGFEGGWGGDYSVFPGGAALSMATGAAARSGDFAAELPSDGFARNLTVTLPTQANIFTDGIWACFSNTLSNPPRRIRHWFNGITTVVELYLRADARLQMTVAGYSGPPLITTTPLSTCPNYTRIELQYRSLAAGGAAFLRMNGQLELFPTHASPFTVTQTRIGVDDGADGPTLRWDDHTLATGVVWPGNLRIIGLAPTADGVYGTDWQRQGCPAGARFPCVQSRPPNSGVFLSDDEELSRISFCADGALDSGAIAGVKTLAALREQPDDAAPVGLFLRSGGCANPDGMNHPEVPFDVPSSFTGFARVDETNPATGQRWNVGDLATTEFGIRHANDEDILFISQLAVEVIYDPDAVSPGPTATATLTATRTLTTTPTFTTTPTETATPTETTRPSETVPTRTATRTRTATATVTETALTPIDTATVSATPSITRTPAMTGTPTDTPTGPTFTASATSTSTATATATATGPTPTVTSTFRVRGDYVFASSDANSWECSFNRAADLGFSSSVSSLEDLTTREDADRLHSLFLSIYVSPGLLEQDYTRLQTLVAPPSENQPKGGLIDRFVSLGGLAVIHVAPPPTATPSTQSRLTVAPRDVGYQPPLTTDNEQIATPLHPFITGEGFGGEPLGSASFSGWDPTDRGFLINVPPDATILLRNPRGPTMIEYNHGAGKVIVTTLTFCTPSEPASMGDALDNLLKYARFYMGSAQTPAFTVTSTPTPTPTITGQATRTSTRTRTPPVTPTETETPTPDDTPTATPVSCAGDCDGDGGVTINELLTLVNISLNSRPVSDCPAGDVTGGDPSGPDGEISVDELIRAVNNALNQCGA
jgi:hypothetical protein